MKTAVNSSFAKVGYSQVATARAAWWSLGIPRYVWLGMIVLAAMAMVVSTIRREQQEVQRARANHAQTYRGVTQLESENARLKAEITRLKTDRSLAEREAQRKLNYVRPSEIVVPIR